MKHLKKFISIDEAFESGTIDMVMSPLDRVNNANPAIELEEENVSTLNVYKATAHGLDNNGFIIVAKSIEEVIEIGNQENMGSIDPESVSQIQELQTTQTESGVVTSF